MGEAAKDSATKDGLIQQEISEYKAALEKRPSFYKACYNLALAYHKIGDLPGEIKSLERAIELKSRYPEALYNLAYAYEENNQNDKAMEIWSRYSEVASHLESEKPFVEIAQKEIERLKKGSPSP